VGIDQRYVIEEGVQQRYVADRDARRFLPFLLPHVRPGVEVLDVGCGVGSIALDLASTVAPGRVVGIDADSRQIEAARTSAAERGVENVEFVTSSVYELPFAEASFDVVYANAVLMYVRDQVRALAEIRRVLRPQRPRGRHRRRSGHRCVLTGSPGAATRATSVRVRCCA
jgi:ubiquinone/menaquinone biosynthesis C-methylase UbiE